MLSCATFHPVTKEDLPSSLCVNYNFSKSNIPVFIKWHYILIMSRKQLHLAKH